MGGTFKWEIHKNVKKIKLCDYIGRYARKKKTVPPYSTFSYGQKCLKIAIAKLKKFS
jgi:hypothetical protein